MLSKRISLLLAAAVVIISVVLLYNDLIIAHCDTLDGPVVGACKKSLETGNINYTLIWVQEKDEHVIREAFDKTLKVRTISSDARELADLNFFETVVRIHRAGEGASYSGLKPAGSIVDPSIIAGDKAIETGSVKELEVLINNAIHQKLEEHFNNVMSKKKYDANDVHAGREYVKAYVEYIHFAENIYNAAQVEHNIHKTDQEIQKEGHDQHH